VGAALVVGIQNYFAELGAWVTMIQGAIFVIVVMAFRRGIVGELIPLLHAHLGETGQRAKAHIALATAAADPVDGDRRSSGDSPFPVVAVGSPCKTTDGAA
jgi:hypothetical protein